jgi:hypothetical protein
MTKRTRKVGQKAQEGCWYLCVELYPQSHRALYSRRGADQAGLFSGVVAAFVLVSYQQLQPNPNDLTNQLLGQISQQLSMLQSGTSASVPLTLANQPPFQPTASAVRVNALWIISLGMSLSCALLATLLQQWTRRFVQVADAPYNTEKRALIRAFFADGVDRFGFAAAVEILPAQLHLSIILFYIGLVDFFGNINHTIAYFLLGLGVYAALGYALLTIVPLFYPNSPYQTPFTPFVWFIIEATPLVIHWLRPRTRAVQNAIDDRRAKIQKGMRNALELYAYKSPGQAYFRALEWMVGSLALDEDDKLVDFLDGLPGIFQTKDGRPEEKIEEGLEQLVKPVIEKLLMTCRPGFLPEDIRVQRLTACLGAVWCFSTTIDRHFEAVWGQWAHPTNNPWGTLSIETWETATNMTADRKPLTAIKAHCIQALVAVMWRKGKWTCSRADASRLLQSQLGASSVDIDNWYEGEGHLELAVVARLLSDVLPLLRKLETTNEKGVALKAKIKDILDKICDEVDTSNVPDNIRSRFANGSEVAEVFPIQHHFLRHSTNEMHGPWTKIFTPVETKRGNY